MTRREGEEWGWDAQLEVAATWWQDIQIEIDTIIFLMVVMVHSEHSGGVVEGGDHHPLIGGEQSWRKGESGKLLTLSTTNV